MEAQTEVTDHPQEAGKIFLNFFRVAFTKNVIPDLIWSSFDKLMIKLKELIAFSSIVFMELKMKLEHRSIASKKILVS